MILIYNGIQLPLTRITMFNQRPVYSDDGADVLYYHFRIGAECNFNPGVFAANWFNQSRSVVTATSPHLGPFTNVAPELSGAQPLEEMPASSIVRLRLALLAPRRLLVLQDDRGVSIIESPVMLNGGEFAGGYTNPGHRGPPDTTLRRAKTDCANGPKPIAFNVLSWESSKTARCYYEVETWIKECPPIYSRTRTRTTSTSTGGYTNPNLSEGGYTAGAIGGFIAGVPGASPVAAGTTNVTTPGQSAVISHRWEESHSINDLGWTTRQIAGQIRFRKDVLIETRLEPDDFRIRLFPRIPLGFIRTVDGVGTTSDGLTCYYKVTDTQEPRSLTGQFKQYRFRGNYTAGFDNSSGILPIRFEQLHLEIWGQPNITGVAPAAPVVGAIGGLIGGIPPVPVAAVAGPNIRMIMVNDLFTLANQLVAFGGENLQSPALGRFHGSQVWVDLYERHAVLDTKWTLGGVAGFLEEIGSAVVSDARAQAIIMQELLAQGVSPQVAFIRAPQVLAFRRAQGIPTPDPSVPRSLTLLQKVEKAIRNNSFMTDFNVNSITTPPPARGPHARGTYAGLIVAQALKATCETPDYPPARPEARRPRVRNQGNGGINGWNIFGVPERRRQDAAGNRGSINSEAGF